MVLSAQGVYLGWVDHLFGSAADWRRGLGPGGPVPLDPVYQAFDYRSGCLITLDQGWIDFVRQRVLGLAVVVLGPVEGCRGAPFSLPSSRWPGFGRAPQP